MPPNAGKEWSKSDVDALRRLAKTAPARVIAYKLGRSIEAIRMKASKENISLGRIKSHDDREKQVPNRAGTKL